MNEEQKNDVALAAELPISEEQWLAERKTIEEEMDNRAAEHESRIVALESRIGALLKNRPESKRVEVEKGEYANYDHEVSMMPKVGDSSFIPIDGL